MKVGATALQRACSRPRGASLAPAGRRDRIVAALGIAAVAASAAGCASPIRLFSSEIVVVDELGAPIAGVAIELGDRTLTSDKRGRVALPELDGPVMAVARGPNLLPEPIVVGRANQDRGVVVRMLSDRGGQRWVMHGGGDLMLGRRYLEAASGDPGDPAPALIPAGDIAGASERVVEALRRAFAAADLSTVNLDTAMTDLPDDAVYPAKRSTFKTSPAAIAALEALGVDLAVLANDHMRDYGDAGIADTLAVLDGAGIARVGAYPGDPASGGNPPAIVDVAGLRVGVLAWSTVTGATVNDRYPRNDEVGDIDPDQLDERLHFQLELREWGYAGAAASVPTGLRVAGEAWRRFEELEAALADPADIAAAWASLVAVYPELQDWVAQRGHGGAAPWQREQAMAAVQALRPAVDLVVVQLHSGFTYGEAPSQLGRAAARDAIDAGADIVLAHHPHVVQGAEWYRGKLIAYSLGNLAYDLDLLDTLPGAFLRTVWDGSDLLEARFVLFEIDGYRPVPVADSAARRAALSLWAECALEAETIRAPDGDIVSLLVERDLATRPAHIRMRNHDAVLVDMQPPEDRFEVALDAGETAVLEYEGLTRPTSGVPMVQAGRDLLGWGHFEDVLADGEAREGTHWLVDSASEQLLLDPGAPAGLGYLRLARRDSSDRAVTTRLAGRIRLPRHRLYRDLDGVLGPDDGEAEYSLRFLARRYGAVDAAWQLDFYHTGGDPLAPGDATRVQRLPYSFTVPDDGAWHAIELDIPAAALVGAGDVRGDELAMYLRLDPPQDDSAYLDIDEVQLIEWRPVADLPDRFAVYHLLRNKGTSSVLVPIAGLALGPP